MPSAQCLRQLVLAAVACAATAAFASAALAQGQGLRLQRSITYPPEASGTDRPVYLIADRIEGVSETEIEASGDAELRSGFTTLKADRLRYLPDVEEVEAIGNVRLSVRGDEVTGPRLRFRVNEAKGIFVEPNFHLTPRRFSGQGSQPQRAQLTAIEPVPEYKVESRGSAKAMRFEGEDHYRITDGSFTTCKPGQDDWFLRADDLEIDMDRQVATARGARLEFLGVSTPSIPYASFSINNQRKSGFLPPLVGISGKNGLDVAFPYYLNLAPNYDATVAPRYLARRGPMLMNEFRYLQPYSFGTARADWLPEDKATGEERYAYSWQHTANYLNGWYGNANINRVSDDNYFRDLSGRLAVATQIYLPREGLVGYSSPTGWWNAFARVQKFQTLQDPLNPVAIPYERVPQLRLSALRQIVGGLDLGLEGEGVAFEGPGLPSGRRGIVYPSVALPILRPYGYITPKVGVHQTWYNLSDVAPGIDRTPSRTLPIASLDAGLYFDRPQDIFGRGLVQTLEPRVYYLYVPYRDQAQLPVFDTAVADFNYAQIFSENYYVGGDRISDANQITGAVTSRLVNPSTGQEVVRALVGQRFYFENQRVTLPTVGPRTGSLSPTLAAISGRVARDWIAEATVQYAFEEQRTERLNAGVRYVPGPGHVLSLAYRYTNAAVTTTGEINNVDAAAQWPLWRNLYGVGRLSYDITGRQVVEALAGFEYNADCWILRVVAQRFRTATSQSTNQIFIQLELNGFSRIGSNPIEALRRNIPGYTRINVPGSQSGSAGVPLDSGGAGAFYEY